MMKKVIAFLVLILLAVMAFFYFGTYSEGVRAGVIIKASKRGTIFKTYEAQLNMNAFGAVKGKSALNESFEFSVPDELELVQKIEMYTGHSVKLYYKEKYFVFPWLGETKYLATDIKLTEDNETNLDKNDFPKSE